MDDTQKFPIGKFVPPPEYDPVLVATSIDAIAELPALLRAAVTGLDDTRLDTPYRDGGWTLRQVVHHVADSHTHAVNRTRLTLTTDEPQVAGYDQDDWAGLHDARTLEVEPSLQILTGLHRRWVHLLRSLDEAAWRRAYFHTEYRSRWPLWQVVALYAWHGRHHTAHVTNVRQSRGW